MQREENKLHGKKVRGRTRRGEGYEGNKCKWKAMKEIIVRGKEYKRKN